MSILRIAAIVFTACVMQACTIIRSDAWPANEKKILLSFDDGPNGNVSLELLDVLKKHDVSATFCYIGRNAEKYPAIVKRVADDGHEIVVHSYSRRFPTLFDYNILVDDIEKTREIIRKAAGAPDLPLDFYRPPSGLVTPTVKLLVKRTDSKLAHINFYARDSASEVDKLSQLMKKTKDEIEKRNGASIVFHESRFRPRLEEDNAVDKTWLPTALDDFIVWAKQEGYSFVSFSDMPDSKT